MTAEELQDALMNMFETIADTKDEVEGEDDDITLADFARDIADDLGEVTHTATYGREMMMTRDAGLVVRTADGAEFQITILQSRVGRDD